MGGLLKFSKNYLSEGIPNCSERFLIAPIALGELNRANNYLPLHNNHFSRINRAVLIDLNLDLRSHLNDAIGWYFVVIGSIACNTRHRDEQPFSPCDHAATGSGDDGLAGDKVGCL
jgi:hypothetical protein